MNREEIIKSFNEWLSKQDVLDEDRKLVAEKFYEWVDSDIE